jgi:hypothetical protein
LGKTWEFWRLAKIMRKNLRSKKIEKTFGKTCDMILMPGTDTGKRRA